MPVAGLAFYFLKIFVKPPRPLEIPQLTLNAGDILQKKFARLPPATWYPEKVVSCCGHMRGCVSRSPQNPCQAPLTSANLPSSCHRMGYLPKKLAELPCATWYPEYIVSCCEQSVGAARHRAHLVSALDFASKPLRIWTLTWWSVANLNGL